MFTNTVEFLIIAVYIGGVPVTGIFTLLPGRDSTTAGKDILGGAKEKLHKKIKCKIVTS